MKGQAHIFLKSMLIVLMLGSCNVIKNKSIDEVGGEFFPFHSAITSICDAGDSLIIGTHRGLSSFNLQNGIFRELRIFDSLNNESGGDIYDIMFKDSSFLFYSVQDGGIRRIERGKWRDDCAVIYNLYEKGTEYSAYELSFCNNDDILASTSNGVFYWTLSKPEIPQKALAQLDSLAPMRFYSIEQNDKYGYLCSGEDGIYRYEKDRDTLIRILPANVQTAHDDYLLLHKGSFAQFNHVTKEIDTLFSFQYSPRDFVIHERQEGKSYIYAISVSTVEVAELQKSDAGIDGKILYTIHLPEKHITRPRNKSARQIGIINHDYLYVSPGGNGLYKIPLAPYIPSDEVISICHGSQKRGERVLYLLTAKHDLFSLSSTNRLRYLRSFHTGGQIQLLGALGDWLVVSENGVPICYKGYKKKIRKPLEPVHDFANASKITCNIWEEDNENTSTSGVLYQGRGENVRKYQYSLSPFFNLPQLTAIDSVSFVKQVGDGLISHNNAPDYYPVALARIDKTLIVGTLHSGVVYKDVTDSVAPFRQIQCDSTSTYSRVIDIKVTNDSTLFVLDDNNVYRFFFESGTLSGTKPFSLSEINKSLHNSLSNYYNHIHPISSTEFYLFSDYYDFQKGFDAFEITKNRKIDGKVVDNKDASTLINGALTVANTTYLASSKGLGYVKNNRLIYQSISTTQFHRIVASFWPWDLVAAVVSLLLILFLFFRKRLRDFLLLHSINSEFGRVETTEECKETLKRAKSAKMLTINAHHKLIDLISQIESKHNELAKNEQEEEHILKIERTKTIRKELFDKYPHGYVISLFDTLVSISSLKDIDLNIGLFMEEEKARNGQNRLFILDQIGSVIFDAIKLVFPNSDAGVSKSFDELLGIIEKYPIEKEIKNWDKVSKERKTFISQNNTIANEGKTLKDKHPVEYTAFDDLYYYLQKTMIEKYDKYGAMFFSSYTAQDLQHKEIFNSLEYYNKDNISNDENGNDTNPPFFTKQTFLFFPVCAIDPVGNFLFDTETKFSKYKSDWKRPQNVADKKDDPKHHLPNLANETDYKGLFGLMAKAGLDMINKVWRKKGSRDLIEEVYSELLS